MTPTDLERRFADLVERLGAEPDVERPVAGGRRPFGSSALKVHGRIFAMLVGGALAVKLPRARVDELIAAGDGGPFRSGRGSVMREWLQISEASAVPWEATAREALAFVRAERATGPRATT